MTAISIAETARDIRERIGKHSWGVKEEKGSSVFYMKVQLILEV